ncbi:MAG: molybdate ABC transporter substrate-binding protein [Burkholderiales bacterium]
MKRSSVRFVLTLLALLFTCQAIGADLVVSAAASLTNAFADIGKEFEKAKPGAKVLFNFASSGQLLQQLSRGAPVDVFASADQQTMDKAEKQNLIVQGTRENFVRNKLVVVVPANSKVDVKNLEALGSADVKRIALANPESVPVGIYSKQALEAAGLWDRLKDKTITTTNVRQSLDYTARGEVDTGFVYLTDALIMPNRVKIAFEVPTPTEILYPIAAVKGNGNENRAREFIAYLKSETAQNILQKYGFGKP